MLESRNAFRDIRTAVAIAVAARRGDGMDDDAIRREVLDVAKRTTRAYLPEDLEYETAVAEAQREIDRILSGGEPFVEMGGEPMGEFQFAATMRDHARNIVGLYDDPGEFDDDDFRRELATIVREAYGRRNDPAFLDGRLRVADETASRVIRDWKGGFPAAR